MRYRSNVEPGSSFNGNQVGVMHWRYRNPPNSPWVLYTSNPPSNGGALSTYPNRVYETCWDEIHPGPPYRDGGPFNKWCFDNNFSSIQYGGGANMYTGFDASREWRYVGGFTWSPITLDTYFPNLGVINTYKTPGTGIHFGEEGAHVWGDADYYGALAWKKYRPGKNIADASVFLVELRDMPRQLMTTARMWRDNYVLRFGRDPRRKAKIAADHWLNTQFGWLPFVRDIQKFYKAWKKADATVQYIIRNNGKWIKRGGPVDLVGEENAIVTQGSDFRVQNYLPACLFPEYPLRGKWTVLRSSEKRSWFEGWFRYYVPNIDTVKWRKSAIRTLWGLDLSPAALWELIPWSWLVDWFSNVGDLIDVSSGSSIVENLVAKDAYVMCESFSTLDFETIGYLTPMVTLNWRGTLSRKNRVKASPFGFNLSEEEFSLRQWSILSALGITKFKRPARG